MATPRSAPVFDVQVDGIDLALGVPLRWGPGYALPTPTTFPFVPDRRICFWFGAGGSFVMVDHNRRTTAASVVNRLHGSPPTRDDLRHPTDRENTITVPNPASHPASPS